MQVRCLGLLVLRSIRHFAIVEMYERKRQTNEQGKEEEGIDTGEEREELRAAFVFHLQAAPSGEGCAQKSKTKGRLNACWLRARCMYSLFTARAGDFCAQRAGYHSCLSQSEGKSAAHAQGSGKGDR